MRLAITVAVLLVVALPAVAEDLVTLKDGQEISGKILSETEKEIRIKVGEGEFILPRSLVATVKREAPAEKASPAAPDKNAEDVIKLRNDGREIRGKILGEDESTITMKVGDATLSFDKAVVEWLRKDGTVRRLAAPPEPARPTRTREPAPRGGGELTPAMKAWAELCVKHLGSEDPGVQRSASSALRVLGPAARPMIEAAANGTDERVAAAAKRLLEGGRGGGFGGRGGGRGNFADRLAEALSLTEEQKPKVNAIFQESMQKRQELGEAMRNGELDREGMRAKMQEIQEASTKQLSEVLTEEQMTRYQEMMQRMGGGRRGGGGRVPR